MELIRLKKLLKLFSVMSFCILSSTQASTDTTDNTISNEVVVFVSFSMPINSLQEWSIQAQKIHAPLVIRGLVNDSFLDTQKAVKQIIGSVNKGGVVVDPRLFQQYHITQVPSVLIRHKNNSTCLSNQSCWSQESFDVVAGDIGLESALQEIAERGDNTVIAQKLLATWRQT